MKLQKRLSFIFLATFIMFSGIILPAPAFADMQPHPEKPLDKNNLQKPLEVKNVEKLENGVKLDLGEQVAYIHMLTSDTSKVSILKKGEKEEDSPGILKKDWSPPKILKIVETSLNVIIRTDSLTIDIKKNPFGIKYMDKNGNVINEDAEQGAGYEDGKPYVFKKTDKNENFYGFGMKSSGLNHRGDEIGVWHQDPFPYESKYGYSSVPFFIGLKDEKAYGILFDTTWRSNYNLGKESDDYYYFYADGGKLTYYFINGPEIKDVVDRYTDLTGKMELPPEWALGFHQASWGYHQKDLEEVAKTYREKKIPADTIYADIEWMNDYKNFEWGENFPDPDGLNQTMDKLNFHQVNIIDPAIRVPDPGQPEYLPYTDGTQKDLWVKNTDGSPFLGKVWPWGVPSKSVFPNFLKQETRDWWAQWQNTMFEKGVDGIWNDMNEPVNFSQEDHWTLPLDKVFETDDGSKKTHEEVHNIYGHLEAEATHQAWDKFKPNDRPFILTRAYYTGTQRYAGSWTGDNHSSWEHLKLSMSQNANMGLSGMAFVGNDIGGFSKNKQAGEVVTPELFARWVELGAFNPYSRDHYNNDGKSPSTTESYMQRQEPWQFGKEVEDISRKYISMRYELMPYLYNAFHNAHESGNLVQQPLVFQFQDDPNTYNIEDQVMFGDSLMIAPVVKKDATSRSVYLPAGEKWVDYWTGEEFEGGQTITKQADLGTLPIYVKQDSIIPRREVQQYTGEKKLTNLILDTYLNNETSYSFYEDDGKSEDYKEEKFNVTDFDVKNKGNVVEFEQDKKTQNYASNILSYTLKLHDTERPKKVQAASNKYKAVNTIEEVTKTSESYYYDEAEKTLYINIPVEEEHKVKAFFPKKAL